MELLSAPIPYDLLLVTVYSMRAKLEDLLAAGGRMSDRWINGKREGLQREIGRREGVLIIICIAR